MHDTVSPRSAQRLGFRDKLRVLRKTHPTKHVCVCVCVAHMFYYIVVRSAAPTDLGSLMCVMCVFRVCVECGNWALCEEISISIYRGQLRLGGRSRNSFESTIKDVFIWTINRQRRMLVSPAVRQHFDVICNHRSRHLNEDMLI